MDWVRICSLTIAGQHLSIIRQVLWVDRSAQGKSRTKSEGSSAICGPRTWKSGVNWPPEPRGSAAPASFSHDQQHHRRQPHRGCRGRIPTNILVGGDINGNVPTNIRGGNVVEYELKTLKTWKNGRYKNVCKCRIKNVRLLCVIRTVHVHNRPNFF